MKEVRKLLRFNVHLTDHCNLNCISCGHFSPIASEKYLDIIQFENDCKRLSELTNGEVERIELMGGEPLLHPKLLEIIGVARRYFNGTITIATNGLLLHKQKDEFWSSCYKNNIEIGMTAYPIKLDMEFIKRKSANFGVTFSYKGEDTNSPRLWFYNPIDLKGEQDIVSNFNVCNWGNVCIFLEDSKLYTCVVPALIKNLNQYFGIKISSSEKNYINIHKVKNIEEILNFLNNPIPFCKYCLPNNAKIINWKHSEKSISEWI